MGSSQTGYEKTAHLSHVLNVGLNHRCFRFNKFLHCLRIFKMLGVFFTYSQQSSLESLSRTAYFTPVIKMKDERQPSMR